MQNKIILFSNIKGGVGKTTLCSLFASYLAENGIPVIAIDADLQASLFRHRQRETDADPDVQAPWNVELLNTSDGNNVASVLEKNDRNLEIIYKAADGAVIPMSFDADTVDATGIFIKAFKTISKAQLVFIPNRINPAEKRADELHQRASTIEFLGLVGTVVPQVKQCVAVKRYTTLYSMDSKQRDAVENAFNKIMETLDIKK